MSRVALIDLQRSLLQWIPKRKETIRALEKALQDISSLSSTANSVKFYGACGGAAANAVAGLLGLVAIFGSGGMASLLVEAGTVASMVGTGGAAIQLGAELSKMDNFVVAMEEAQNTIDREIDAYKTVVHKLGKLDELVTEKIEKGTHGHHPYKLNVSMATLNTAATLLSGYSFMTVEAAQIASASASNRACGTLLNSTRHPSSKILSDATREILKLPSRNDIQLATTKAAKGAIDQSTVGRFISTNMAKKLAETSGEISTEAAFDTVELFARKKGGELIMDGEMAGLALHVTKETTAPAAREAGRKVIEESTKSTAKNVGGVINDVVGTTSAFIGETLVNTLPLFFAGWNVYEACQASSDIAEGSKEEKFLRRKIQELKQEANTIVDDIFNAFAAEERRELQRIDTPFPPPHR